MILAAIVGAFMYFTTTGPPAGWRGAAQVCASETACIEYRTVSLYPSEATCLAEIGPYAQRLAAEYAASIRVRYRCFPQSRHQYLLDFGQYEA